MIPTAHTEVTMKIHCPSKHMPVWKQFVFSLKLLGLIINWAILLKVNPFSSHWELLFLIKQFSWFAILFMSHLRLKFAHLHHCFYKALVFYSLPVSPHNYIYFSVCFDVGQLEALLAPSYLYEMIYTILIILHLGYERMFWLHCLKVSGTDIRHWSSS